LIRKRRLSFLKTTNSRSDFSTDNGEKLMVPIWGIVMALVVGVVVTAVPGVMVVVVAVVFVALGIDEVDANEANGYGGLRGAGWGDDAAG
jgi:hypothetical protein